MKANEHIVVWVSPEGAITIHAKGFTGSTCEEATRFLEEGLGTVGRRQHTRDWFRKTSRQTNTNNQQEQQT